MLKNKIIITACLAVVITLVLSFTLQQPGHNFKVLPQNISRDSLTGLMRGYSRALGVKCDFCHARNTTGDTTKLNFASDDKKEKGYARHMMVMTSEINKNYFNFMQSAQPDTIQMVKCVTCHRGKSEPELPKMEEHEGMMPPPQGPPPGGK
ncbi:MAG: c-type cytochrome [Chitinophagaceae bacterium]|jgi:hypothetical protein|nr:c-type cytochrome [Chitinophagaceae bacterium]